MMHWLWGVAENMDWHRSRPRWFWRWLLVRMDRRYGYYEGYRPVHGPQVQQGPMVSNPHAQQGSRDGHKRAGS